MPDTEKDDATPEEEQAKKDKPPLRPFVRTNLIKAAEARMAKSGTKQAGETGRHKAEDQPETPANASDKTGEDAAAPEAVPGMPAGDETVMSSRSALRKALEDRMTREGGQLNEADKPNLKGQEEAHAASAAGASGEAPKRHINIDPAEAHVLVVEDNVPNFVLIARLLAYMGIQRCEWKTSGWQVVEFADTLPRIDLILMDIRLPYEDGYQALQRVRSNPRLKETLVIAVTAEADAAQMEKAKASGFDGFLGKPLDPERFPEQIRRVLRGEPVWEYD